MTFPYPPERYIITQFYIKAWPGSSPFGPVTGTIIGPAIFQDKLPEGWLVCDGSSFDPEKYPELAAVLTITPRPASWWERLFRRPQRKPYMPYGTNRLPDLRGRVR